MVGFAGQERNPTRAGRKHANVSLATRETGPVQILAYWHGIFAGGPKQFADLADGKPFMLDRLASGSRPAAGRFRRAGEVRRNRHQRPVSRRQVDQSGTTAWFLPSGTAPRRRTAVGSGQQIGLDNCLEQLLFGADFGPCPTSDIRGRSGGSGRRGSSGREDRLDQRPSAQVIKPLRDLRPGRKR